MKKFLLMFVAALTLAACEKVPAGHKGVKVYLLGGEKGVESEELGVGRYWIGFNEELYLFPTFTQNYTWTADSVKGSESDESISFQTREGMVVNADVGISYSIQPDRVTDIFQKYRKGVDEITDTYLRNMVRDSLNKEASSLPVSAVYGEGKVGLIQSVERRVREEVGPLGITVERIYWAGELRFPAEVTASLNAKIRATQEAEQRENEIKTTKAEALKAEEKARGEANAVMLRAQAEADANLLISKSLTPELVQYEAIKRWTGELPRMTGGSAIPFVDVTEEVK